MTEPEIDPEKVKEGPEEVEQKSTMDSPEGEFERYRSSVSELHDLLDTVKNVAPNLSEELREKAEETDSEEFKNEYIMLANTAEQAYRRVENGDRNVVRGGL